MAVGVEGKRGLKTSLRVLGVTMLLSACMPVAVPMGGQVPLEYSPEEGRISSLESALADAMIEIEKMKARTVSSGDELPAIPPNACLLYTSPSPRDS